MLGTHEQRRLLSLGPERLAALLAQACKRDPQLCCEVRAALGREEARDDRGGSPGSEPHMVGGSEAMLRVYGLIRKYAATDAPVLITGESGTGKELAALALHERSRYAAGPFIPINCGGLPAELAASELFGYERGAFTGATQRKLGRIEAAQGGTVLLDEIGDLPLELQSHLLRFLQERTIDRIGSKTPVTVDVRVVAATHVDLARAVAAGRFREDLFYRLNVLTLHMPPLRERREDIELIAMFFLEKFAREMSRPARGFAPEAIAAIRSHGWPGNVRELISCMRRAVVMAEGDRVTLQDLNLNVAAGPARTGATDGNPVPGPRADGGGPADNGSASPWRPRGSIDGDALAAALRRHANNVTRASQSLGVSRVTLYRLVKRYGIDLGRGGSELSP